MRQSDARTAGRGGMPASFGREKPQQEKEEDFTIRGGQALHLVLHLEVTPTPESLASLHAAVRATTRDAVLAGYADAFAEMDDEPGAGEPPGGGDGGAPPGPPPD